MLGGVQLKPGNGQRGKRREKAHSKAVQAEGVARKPVQGSLGRLLQCTLVLAHVQPLERHPLLSKKDAATSA